MRQPDTFTQFSAFIDAVFEDQQTEIRLLRGGQSKSILLDPSGELEAQYQRLAAHNQRGWNVYAVINEIKAESLQDGKAMSDADISSVRALFVDLDHESKDGLSNFEKLNTCDPSPHVIVRTSQAHKLQAYWLTDNCSREDFTKLQKAIARKFDGDPSITNLSRIMRIPGFNHVKDPRNPIPCEIVSCDPALAYSVQAVIDGLGLQTHLDAASKHEALALDNNSLAPKQWQHVRDHMAASSVIPQERHQAILALVGVARRSGVSRQQTLKDVQALANRWFSGDELRSRNLASEIQRVIQSTDERLSDPSGTQPRGVTSLRESGFTIPPLPMPDLRLNEELEAIADKVIEISQQYLDTSTLAEIRQAHPDSIILLESALGTGKTTATRELLQDASNLLIVNHLITLTGQLADDFDATSYQDMKPADYAALNNASHRRHVTTINSLPKLIKPLAIGEAPTPFDTVFIDEIDAALHRMHDRDVRNTAEIKKAMAYYLQNARTVIAASAYIDDAAAVSLKKLAPDKKIILVRNTHKPAGLTFSLSQGTAKDHHTRVLQALSAGHKVVCPVDSRRHAHTLSHTRQDSNLAKKLADEVRKQLPHVRVLRVDASTRGEAHVQAFIEDPDTECQKYDFIIYTPTLGAGFSVSAGHGFKALAYSCANSVPPADFMQLTARFRGIEHLEIISKAHTSYKPVTLEEVKNQILATQAGEHTTLSTNGMVIEDLALLEMQAITEACRNRQTNNYLATLHSLLVASGRREIDAPTMAGDSDLYQTISQAVKELRLTSTFMASDIGGEEYRRLKDSPRTTEADFYTTKRYELKAFYGLAVDHPKDELERIISLDDEGKLRPGVTHIVHAAITKDAAMLAALRELELRNYRHENVASIPDHKLRTYKLEGELYREILSLLDLDPDALARGEAVSVDYLASDDLLARIYSLAAYKKRRRYQRLLQIPAARTLKSKSGAAIRWLNTTLRSLGFTIESKRVRTSGDDRVYSYQLSTPHADLIKRRFDCLMDQLDQLESKHKQAEMIATITAEKQPEIVSHVQPEMFYKNKATQDSSKARDTRNKQDKITHETTQTFSVISPRKTRHGKDVITPQELAILERLRDENVVIADTLDRYRFNKTLYASKLRSLLTDRGSGYA